MTRSTRWEVLGVQKRWPDGSYAYVEDYEKARKRRWRWYLTSGDGPEPYEFEGTAPTLALGIRRAIAAREDAVRR